MEFYSLLQSIRQRPGLYIGYPSITNLFMFLSGYKFSRQAQGLTLTLEETEFQEFQPWLQKRFNVNTSASWARIILLYTIDEVHGFTVFFELLDEFIIQQKMQRDQQISVPRLAN